MEPSLLVIEAPALRGAVLKLFGSSAVSVVAGDYERVAALGGNVEVGLEREEGVRYNPRIARISLLALDEGGICELHHLRGAVWSALRDARMLVELQDGDVRRIAERVLAAGSDDDTPILTIRAVIALDTVRHLHMTTLETADKRAYLNSTLIRSLLESDSSVPAHLKVKLQHAVNMQERVLMDSGDGVLDG
jgi:hypothetical protein